MSGWGPLSAQSAAIGSAQAVALYNLGIDPQFPQWRQYQRLRQRLRQSPGR